MNSLAAFPDITRLVPLLGSDKQGEVLAAVGAIERTLRRADRDWHDLAIVISAGARAVEISRAEIITDFPETEIDVARWCQDHDGGRLTAGERDFVANALRACAYGKELTEKQRRWLLAIYRALGGRL